MAGGSSELSCAPAVLLKLVKAGDSSALDRITACYGERLLTAGRQHCRTVSEAEDAVQDTLLIATDRLDSFRGEGSLEGWLVRIVAHACRRLSRGQKNDAASHFPLPPLLVSPQRGPEDATQHSELRQFLASALAELTPEERAIVLLAEVEDWSAADIGREFGHTAGAVRTRLTRIRSKLRDKLEKDELL